MALQGEGVMQLPVKPVPPLRAGFGDLANGNLFSFLCVALHALAGIEVMREYLFHLSLIQYELFLHFFCEFNNEIKSSRYPRYKW